MTTFSEFLPMDRRAALAGDYALPDRATGAALFADISGFTPLTFSLVEKFGADRGAEMLTELLNRVFGSLVAQAHKYQGSVIGFSGDALTCWFEGDDGRRAVTSALDMQTAIAALDTGDMPTGTDSAIGIKVAVAAGAARRFLVGVSTIPYVEVLAGRLLDRTAAGESLAGQGQVIVSAEVLEVLGEELNVVSEITGDTLQKFYVIDSLAILAKPTPWPDTAPIAAETTSCWILPPVYQRLELAEGQFVSELRQATVLFLKFTGIDYDGDDAAGKKLDAFICWIQAVLERYDASLVQVTFGDKGSYILMVFGAPVAHEDDTWRALSAALEFRHPPEHLEYISNIQVGVNRGLIFAGTYGGSGSLTYGVLGDATNVAARLMGWAKPGQILVPARLVSTAGVDFEFQEMGKMVMKGLMGPMSVASLEGHSAMPREVSRSPAGIEGGIVGRSSERVAAKESLSALGDGQSLVLLVEGEAGIGKSQLVAEILEEASQSGFETFEGNGDAVEQSSPYFAWRRIVRSALNEAISDQSNTITQEAVVSRLQGFDPDLVRLAPLLNTVLAIDIPENDLTKSMSGEVRADNTNRLMASILGWRASLKPMVVVLDDAHWLDSASMGLARVVVRDVTPLLLVIAARPFDYASEDYEHLRQRPTSRLLSLNLLSSDEILAIASRRLGVDGLPKPVADLILSKAEGHPFFW